MGKREHSNSDLYFPEDASTSLMAAHKNSCIEQDLANSHWVCVWGCVWHIIPKGLPSGEMPCVAWIKREHLDWYALTEC